MVSDHHGHNSLDLGSPWREEEIWSAGPWARNLAALEGFHPPRGCYHRPHLDFREHFLIIWSGIFWCEDVLKQNIYKWDGVNKELLRTLPTYTALNQVLSGSKQ